MTKHIENIQITTKGEDDAHKFQQVCADATILARNLANTRGSVGTPDYMQEQIENLLSRFSTKVEYKVLDAAQLQELGMNMFYNVGKGAVSQPRCIIVKYMGNP